MKTLLLINYLNLGCLNHVNFGFALFSGLVGLSILFLIVNRNLIYSVLNLGLLSILLIIMWMYYLEVNFILIVYILAFIGAIVMLFLSVVLMLPSSTFTEDKLYSSSPPLVVSSVVDWAEKGAQLAQTSFFFILLINLAGFVAFIYTYRHDWARSSWSTTKVRNYCSSLIGRFLKLKEAGAVEEKVYQLLNYITIPSITSLEAGFNSLWVMLQKNYYALFDFIGQLFYKLIFLSVVIIKPQNHMPLAFHSRPVYAENLIAIKSILYVEQPLLLLLSVVGLLIALFGVTAVVSEKTKVQE